MLALLHYKQYDVYVTNRKVQKMDDIDELALETVTGDGTKKPLTLAQRLAYRDDEPTEDAE